MAILLLLFGTGFLKSIVIGVLAFAVVGLILNWLWCSGSQGTAITTSAATTPTPAPAKPAEPAPAPAPAAAAPAPAPAKAADPAKETPAPKPAPAASSEPLIKPSTALAGQQELSERKGSWKYEGGSAPAPAAKAAPAPKAAEPAPAATATAADAPATLSAARAGGADDLKLIKGVGPKLEILLNTMGFYHFDQVASWTDKEVAWVDQNLQGFKGRVSRDNWVEQAKILASGGETEFSARKK
ncbi:endonuclease [Arenibacterium sp. CAU 1754]